MLFAEFVRFFAFLMLAGLVKLYVVKTWPDSTVTDALKALY